jgi:hypothetical protein
MQAICARQLHPRTTMQLQTRAERDQAHQPTKW